MGGKLILTSYGLTSKHGREIIRREIMGDGLDDKRIFVFHEPHNDLEEVFIEACMSLGFKKENIILSGKQKKNKDIVNFDYIYCTGGNTYEIRSLLGKRRLLSKFKEAVNNGATYIGASAGAMIAGANIIYAKDFDENSVKLKSLRGLGLFNGIIIPHYTKEDLERYKSHYPGIDNRYEILESVDNEGVVVMYAE